MPSPLAANIGSYPRIGEEKDQQRHRRGLAHFLRKEISAHAFRDVEQSVAQEAIQEQIAAGIDEVTDGLVGWQDPISPFCKNISGIDFQGITRYFDTNFYFRLPVITSRPRLRGATQTEAFAFARSVSNKPVRVVLTGPFTLACHTDSTLKTFQKRENRQSLFEEKIQLEMAALHKAGADIIQIDEPAVLSRPDGWSSFPNMMEHLRQAAPSAKIILAFYFGSIMPLISKLNSLAVDGVNLDITHDGANIFKYLGQNPLPYTVGFGCVNGRNTKLEDKNEIIAQLKPWADASAPARFYITPSCGLEHLPRAAAFSKLRLLAEIRNMFFNRS